MSHAPKRKRTARNAPQTPLPASHAAQSSSSAPAAEPEQKSSSAADAALEAKMQEIEDNRLRGSTRKTYSSGKINFLMFLFHSDAHRGILTPSLTEALSKLATDKLRRDHLRALLVKPDEPPVSFAQITHQIIAKFLVSLTPEGDIILLSRLSSARSAVKDLFSDYHVSYSKEMENEISRFYRNCKVTSAIQHARAGKAYTSIGKYELEFSMYREIAEEMLVSDSTSDIFCHTFFVLSWNLMCRAGSVSEIALENMEWFEDCLRVKFSHAKNDQTGERSRHPRHLYANPENPEMCVITALAMYFLTTNFKDGHPLLFNDEKQYQRYYQALSRAILSPKISARLKQQGIDATHFATHSVRKGAATYCASLANGPAIAMILLRGGWTLQGIEGKYIREEQAGDKTVGRCLSGLPFASYLFASLPPHFPDLSHPDVQSALKKHFPNHPPHLDRILAMCLASLVHHFDYLKRTLPPTHRVLHTRLFSDAPELAKLRSMIVSGIPNPTKTSMTASGVPLMNMMMLEIKTLRDSVHQIGATVEEKILPAIDRASQETIAAVQKAMEVKSQHEAVTLGDVTQIMQSFQITIASQVRSAIQELLPSSSPQPRSVAQPPPATASHPRFPVYTRNGKLCRLPATFVLPCGSPLVAFQKWLLPTTTGDPYPPLREVEPRDIPSEPKKSNDDEKSEKAARASGSDNQRKRFSDYKALCSGFETTVRSINAWKEDPSHEQVDEMFAAAATSLLTDVPQSKRQALLQGTWQSFLKNVPKLRSNHAASTTASATSAAGSDPAPMSVDQM